MSHLVRRLAAWSQYPLPHHLLSRLTGWVTGQTRPWIRGPLIRWFVRRYGVDLTEAAEPDLAAYPTFQDFFTRPLREGTRPVCPEPSGVACPVDGTLSQVGTLPPGAAIRAKGSDHDPTALLGGFAREAEPFYNGQALTVYLAPRDYHRVHMPVAGSLRAMAHVPGRAFSVGPATTAHIPGLFTRNERVILHFNTAAGPMAVVLVGAMLVATIATAWSGTVTPPRGRRIRRWSYPESGTGAVRLDKGAELGRFNLGSTVIVLFGPGRIRWQDDLGPGQAVTVGQCLGHGPG